MTPDNALLLLNFICAAGVGGIWFRLGALIARADSTDRRIDRLETRFNKLEEKTS